MITRKLSAGDIIEARCTKCRDILNHRIVAMVAEKIVRVECNTCGGTHNYYPPPALKTAKATSGGGSSAAKPATAPRAAKKDPAQADRDEWLSIRQNLNPDRAIAYSMTVKCKVNEVIDHPVFGLGLVKLLIAPNKMQVLFEDGIKLLRCQ